MVMPFSKQHHYYNTAGTAVGGGIQRTSGTGTVTLNSTIDAGKHRVRRTGFAV
jgi:hypothetical protein